MPLPTTTLPIDSENDGGDIDLASAELEDVLADKPVSSTKKIVGSTETTMTLEGEEEEEGGNFEMNGWV
jgi:hypothetical protein